VTERESLIAAVCADPDDDTVRLAYADWCDENGEPERAEFIRVQVELWRWTVNGEDGEDAWLEDTPEADAANRRYAEVMHWEDSFVGLPPDVRWSMRFFFTRGFVSHLTCTQEQFLAPGVAAAVFAAHPVLSVTIAGAEPELSENGLYYRWSGQRPENCHHPHELRFEFIDAMNDLTYPDKGLALAHATARTRDDALLLLSQGSVNIGRLRAKLPVMFTGTKEWTSGKVSPQSRW
jgi:uncharacterized protein (TIGR02996 family)